MVDAARAIIAAEDVTSAKRMDSEEAAAAAAARMLGVGSAVSCGLIIVFFSILVRSFSLLRRTFLS